MKKKILGIVILIVFFGLGLWMYLGQRRAARQAFYYSGTIEAQTQSELAFQVGGRVIEVLVEEGATVKGGQILACLDPREYQASYQQAQAILNQSEKISGQIKTFLEINRKTLPADVTRARAGVASARDTLKEARSDRDRYQQLFARGVVSQKQWEVIKLHYDTSRARLTEAETVLDQAQNNLKKVEATEKEVEAAEALIQSSRAALDLAQIQLEHTQLKAPFAGIITSRNIEPGMVVSPNRQVLTLSDLSTVKLKIFVDEPEIGRVKPGQKVEVKVDTFPDKTYTGLVTFISPEGEFTPKIIQTHKERVKLVYLVQVTVPNPALDLKPGMPADAWLQ